MNLHANIQRTAPAFETTSDLATDTAGAQEEYDFRFISPGYFLCIHGENIGCACEDMTYRCKPPRDACKHIRGFVRLQEYPTNPIDAGMIQLLKAAGWIGSKLHPPDLPKPAKKKLPNIKAPERKPQPQATTRAQKHAEYAGKSTEQIVRGMRQAGAAWLALQRRSAGRKPG
jgi:hypothetical protein